VTDLGDALCSVTPHLEGSPVSVPEMQQVWGLAKAAWAKKMQIMILRMAPTYAISEVRLKGPFGSGPHFTINATDMFKNAMDLSHITGM